VAPDVVIDQRHVRGGVPAVEIAGHGHGPVVRRRRIPNARIAAAEILVLVGVGIVVGVGAGDGAGDAGEVLQLPPVGQAVAVRIRIFEREAVG